MTWRVYGGDVVYAHRDSEEEARQLVVKDKHLIERFGYPRVERVVIPFSGIVRAVSVHCGAYVGPAMMLTEMPECGTSFVVAASYFDDLPSTAVCPSCGADCEVDWGDAAEYNTRERAWLPKCPYGDDCSGCDAVGRCTKFDKEAMVHPAVEASLLGEQLRKLVEYGKKQGRFGLSIVFDETGDYSGLFNFGYETPGSLMVAGSGLGHGKSVQEVLDQIVEECGLQRRDRRISPNAPSDE